MSNVLHEWSQINDHLENIVLYLQNLLPKQVKVSTYGGRFSAEDLSQYATTAPAIKVSLLRLQTHSANKKISINSLSSNHPNTAVVGDSEVVMNLTIAITVIAKDMGASLQRHEAAVNLTQFLALTLPHQTFGSENVSSVNTDIDFRNLFNATVDKNKKIAFWGGAFNQLLTVPLPSDIHSAPAHLFWAENVDDDATTNNYQPLENTTDV
mgnify:CR=1 FL=1